VRRDLLEQTILDYLKGAGAGMHMYLDDVTRLTRSRCGASGCPGAL
jgi:hypothetical protein